MQKQQAKKPGGGTKPHPDAFKMFYFKDKDGNELAIYNARNGPVDMTIQVKGVEYRQSLLKEPELMLDWKPSAGAYMFRNVNMSEIGQLAKRATDAMHAKKPFPSRQQRRHYERGMMQHYVGKAVVVKLDNKQETGE